MDCFTMALPRKRRVSTKSGCGSMIANIALAPDAETRSNGSCRRRVQRSFVPTASEAERGHPEVFGFCVFGGLGTLGVFGFGGGGLRISALNLPATTLSVSSGVL